MQVRAVIGLKISQRVGQRCGVARVGRGQPLNQFGDAVADKIAELVGRVPRPAAPRADAVAGVGQVVQRVQQCAVQVKNDGFVHGFPILRRRGAALS